MKTITVYSRPRCVQCDATKLWLDKKGIAYATVDLNQSPDDAAAVIELGYKQAPVIVISSGDPETDIHWSGFRVDFLNKYCSEVAA